MNGPVGIFILNIEYFEPEASALQRRRSAVELQAHCDYEKARIEGDNCELHLIHYFYTNKLYKEVIQP